MEHKKEIPNRWLLVVGAVIILVMVVGFALYAVGVISKLIMSVAFILPSVLVVAGLFVYFKQKGVL